MKLILHNHLIDAPLLKIVTQLKIQSNGYLKDIRDCGDEIRVTCAFHKGGMENRPSCNICADDNSDIEFGTFHCFSCGASGKLPKLVSACLKISYEEACSWLIENFSNTLIEQTVKFGDFDLSPKKKKYLDPAILKQYAYYHPYMWFRKLSKEVVDKFEVGFDKEKNAITFPVYDEKHRLVMITERSVFSKKFYLPRDTEKPVYLLFDLIENNKTTAFVCESQINCLYMRSILDVPAISLFGTGSEEQYKILKKSGIRHYVLLFDGDIAGRNGAKRFIYNMPNDVFITDIELPSGMDVNDLEKEEVINLLKKNGILVEY